MRKMEKPSGPACGLSIFLAQLANGNSSPSNRVGPAYLLPPAGPARPPGFAGPRTQPIGLASIGLPSLAGPISGVGLARP